MTFYTLEELIDHNFLIRATQNESNHEVFFVVEHGNKILFTGNYYLVKKLDMGVLHEFFEDFKDARHRVYKQFAENQ